VQFVLLVLSIAGYVGLPIILIVGWRRWLRRSSPQAGLSVLSVIGFALGSSSALLAVGTVLYAMAAGGFRYYDPKLLVIYRVGILLSLGGLTSAMGGVWSRGAVRWHALILSVGMLFLWLMWASSE
jgi:hypothetical protein